MKRRVYFKQTLGALLAIVGSGCGASELNCPVPADQKSSFMAMATEFPLKVWGDSDWDSLERSALMRAAALWNTPARESMSREAFQTAFRNVTTLSADRTLVGCEVPEGSDEAFVVHRVESGIQWQSMGFAENTPAVTLRCHRGATLTKQAVLVNPSLIHQDQMMSVFIHELGHALGLDHSCQMDQGSQSFRQCMGLDSDHPYVLAVMYPTLKVRAPSARPIFSTFVPGFEVKESLGSNDLTRVGCIYQR